MKTDNYYLAAALVMALSLYGCKNEDKDAIPMSDLEKGIIEIPCADGKTRQVVDLGIPFGTLWAKCNLGADSPEKTGSFFAWGETSVKTEYTERNYVFDDPDSKNVMLKYVPIADGVHYDGKTELEAEDDAARVLLGGNWRIPTHKDFKDLIACTERVWCKLNGVYGFKFTSTRKGYEENSIFISAAGCMDYEKLMFEGNYGFYWTSTVDGKDHTCAKILWLDNQSGESVSVLNTIKDRYNGLPIRPVTTIE